MNKIGKSGLVALLILAVALTGYWLGTRATSTPNESAGTVRMERKVLYYRNPMGLSDTSPVPKKDSMGMDYVAVYDGEDEKVGQLNISIDKVQKLGVKCEVATTRELNRTLRVTGRIEVNERRTYTVAPKFEGWVEKLHVNTTGQAVVRGQPLFEVYSPELVSAQHELALAQQGLAALKGADEEAQSGMHQLAAASSKRLKNWDISDAPSETGKGRPRVTFRAPISGVVLEKKAVEGMRFMPGEMLYQIADLSSLWVIAEINEQDIWQVKIGTSAKVVVEAYPDRTFSARVDFIYPTLNSMTRTVQVRMEINNPLGLLKPAMFVKVNIPVGQGGKVLSVPTSSVIDSGKKQVVLVRLAEGRFEPRTVKLGQRSDDYVQVLSGVAEGEQVVTSANFLIDAESNLKAVLSGMSAQDTPGESAAGTHEDNAAAMQESGMKKSVVHQARGTLDAINDDGTFSITHEPIASLGWPGMSMDFELANSSLAQGIAVDSAIDFEIVEREPGVWVITKLQAQHGGH